MRATRAHVRLDVRLRGGKLIDKQFSLPFQPDHAIERLRLPLRRDDDGIVLRLDQQVARAEEEEPALRRLALDREK